MMTVFYDQCYYWNWWWVDRGGQRHSVPVLGHQPARGRVRICMRALWLQSPSPSQGSGCLALFVAASGGRATLRDY